MPTPIDPAKRDAFVAAVCEANNADRDNPRLSPTDTIPDLLGWLRDSNHGVVECDHDPDAYPDDAIELWREIGMVLGVDPE